MKSSLHILGQGAVTAVGLDAAQTCAGLRAGIKRFTPLTPELLDDEDPQVCAKVSADPRLRASERGWLLTLAARALMQCSPSAETALLWQVPERHREHPLTAGRSDASVLAELVELLGAPLSEHSRLLHEGAAAVVEGLAIARRLIEQGLVARCIVGGADSLLRVRDIEALTKAQRLLGPSRSQGLVPGEGAAFVVVGRPSEGAVGPAIRGLGIGYERKSVLSCESSVGDAFVQAFTAALHDAELAESKIDFVAGNYNGERYDAWETSHAHARCYQTRRERLPVLWPAKSTGELGVAGGAMVLIATATAISSGYAVGPRATIEIRSEGELRAIAVMSNADSS